jgi:hypothetical protein
MNRPSPIPTTPSRRGFLAVLSAGAASAVAPAALAAPLAPVTETALSGLPLAAAASSEVDPIFALIAEHSAAYAEMAAISGAADLKGRDRDEASEAVMGHSDEVLLRLLTTPPVTLAGVAAILQYLARREWDDPENYNILCGAVQGSAALADAADGFFGNLAATVRAMAGITTIRPIEPSEPDPIYAAIKAEREAFTRDGRPR